MIIDAESNETTSQTNDENKTNETTIITATERKKRRKTLVDSQLKLKILDLIDQGHKINSLAVEYNVGVTTIRDWMKCREKIVELDQLNKTCNLSKKTLKLSDFPQVDKALCIWYYQEKALNKPINGAIICEKAKYFKQFLDLDKTKTIFTASHGFMTNFFQRHGLKANFKKNEENFIISEHVPFNNQLKDLIQKEKYSAEQIFILEEAGLFWKNLPNEKYGQTTKDRIHFGIVFNSNASFKLPMIIVDKSLNDERSNNNMSSLPVYLAHHYKVWLAQNIFETWFKNEFCSRVEQYLKSINLEAKAVLLIENFPTRNCLISTNGLIKCLFRTKNEQTNTSDSPVLSIKNQYKFDLLREILINDKDKDFLKNFTFKKCLNFLSFSWLKTPQLKLKLTFQKYGLNSEIVSSSSQETNDLVEIAQQLEFSPSEIQNWVSSDLNDNLYCILSDEEIIQQVLNENLEHFYENSRASDSSSTDSSSTPNIKSLINSTDLILNWFESQQDIDYDYIHKVLEIREFLCKRKLNEDKRIAESVSLIQNINLETNNSNIISNLSESLREEILNELAEPIKKRNKIVLDNATRIEILEKVNKGQRINDLATEYGCGATTIRDWIKIKDKLYEKLNDPIVLKTKRGTAKINKLLDIKTETI